MALVALKRLSTGLASGLGGILINGILFPTDFILFLLNLLTPDRKAGHVIPEGHPGFGGKWPEYIAPQEGDSRCSCPALNAMANHGALPLPFISFTPRCAFRGPKLIRLAFVVTGILPRSGRNITFRDLNRLVHQTYNFAPTFCFFVPNYAANMLNRSYKTDSFDLSDLDAHNCIEHDASLLRT